jgi:HK97 family phage portal protein
MNFIAKSLFKLALKSAGYSLKDADFGKALQRMFGGVTYAGKTVNPDTAMQISTVWTCVRILAETIGYLSWDMYERKPNGDLQRVDHDLGSVLINSPNADMTSVEYKEAKITNLALVGNTYSYINRRGDQQVSSLYPLVSNNVDPQRNRETGLIEYRINDRGKWETVPRDKMWHVKGFGSNGLQGFSPIGYARQAMGVALAAEEFQARFFASGAKPSLVAKLPDWLEDDVREKAKRNLREHWGGLENSHKLQLLEGGMTLENVSMPLQDAQFIQLRGFSREEILGLYRMPPHLGGDLSRSTNNNIEQQALEFIMYTLAPYLTRIEASATKWLIPVAERSRFILRFNVEALLRADATTRAELHSKYVQNGIMNRNEVRAIEKLPRVEGQGMDDYTVQSNLMLAQDLDKIIDAARKGEPRPPAKESPRLNIVKAN